MIEIHFSIFPQTWLNNEALIFKQESIIFLKNSVRPFYMYSWIFLDKQDIIMRPIRCFLNRINYYHYEEIDRKGSHLSLILQLAGSIQKFLNL